MREVKQSTAVNVMVFMADSSDHISGKTGLALSVEISKDGGAFSSISPTVTERGNGWYSIALSASDTDTLGDLVVRATAAGADPGERVLNVVANVEADSYGILSTTQGSGDVAVDHDYGSTDALRYEYNGQGIDNATIKAYLKTDYDAGRRGESYVKARSKTSVDGRWQWPIYLDSGQTYVIVFYKQGEYRPSTVEIST